MRFGLGSVLVKKILLATVLLAAFSIATRAATLSDIPTSTTWVTNGPVNAIVRTTDTIYLGGLFSYVGPATGSGVPLSTATGKPAGPFPAVAMSVLACAPDGAGGWFIGGDLSKVGTLARKQIAHILADGSVDPAWNPGADETVRTLVVAGGKVYAGGDFTTIGGQPRNHIAALDTASGAVLPWNPNANGGVYSLTVSGSTVYAGGYFSTIGGQTRNRLAALDAVSGAATAWNPDANGGVWDLKIAGTTVYAAGQFTTMGGQARNSLAAVDAASGAVTAWNPNPDKLVYALAVSGATVYAGGTFTSIGGQTRNHLAALNAASGMATAWNPGVPDLTATHPGGVYALAVSSGTVYVGGWFTSIGGQARNGLAAVDTATGVVTPWNPSTAGSVNALAVAGGVVYAGGGFNSVGGQVRNCLAALNMATGEATDWDPNAGGNTSPYVYALAISGGTVYAGGDFSTMGGQTRNYLAAMDTLSGAVKAWNPNAGSSVKALAVSGGTVYAGGEFISVGGQTRYRLAALDAASGAVLPWNPSADSGIRVLTVMGGTVYAGGLFSYVNGQTRRGLAAFDAVSGALTPWNPSVSGFVRALVPSGGTFYVGGSFGSVGGQPRNRLAAVDIASGAVLPWNPGADNTVMALAIVDKTVYVGGGFTSLGGQPRNYLGAVDATSGTVTAWDPCKGGRYDPFLSYVSSIITTGGTVYIGGFILNLGGQARSHFAQFDTPVPPDPPVNPGVTALQANRLTWTWTDGSDNERGFKVYAGSGATAPLAITSNTQAGAQWFVMCGLTPNTQYAFQVAATNPWGDSARTGVFTTFTLAAAPTTGQNVQALAALGAPQPLGTTLVFTNPAGFGPGTHGGGVCAVSAYRWAWDANPTHAFSGREPLWNAGTLTQTPASAGRYYLHLQSINEAGTATPATLDLGAFIAGNAPRITGQPAAKTVKPGAAVSFNVAASGSAPLSYQWIKNGAVLADGGRISGAKNATLNLSNAVWSDSGFYACRVTNIAGTTTSNAARLVVNPTLTVTSAHGSPLPAVGSTAYTSGSLLTVRIPTATIYDPADSTGTTRWVCTGWTAIGSAPASGSAVSVSFKLTQPTTLTWLWKTQYKLTATADPASRGVVKLANGVTAANGSWSDSGTKLTLRAVPNSGSRFAFWWGALGGRSNPGSLTLDRPKTIGARFDRQGNGARDWLDYP